MVIRDSGIVIRDLGLDPRTTIHESRQTHLVLSIFFARLMSLSVTPP